MSVIPKHSQTSSPSFSSMGLPPVAGDSLSQGLLPHDRAMHLFLRKSAQKISDIVIRNFLGLLDRLSLEHLRQRGGRCDGTGTPEGLKFDIDDPFVFIHLEGELQGIPTGYGNRPRPHRRHLRLPPTFRGFRKCSLTLSEYSHIDSLPGFSKQSTPIGIIFLS